MARHSLRSSAVAHHGTAMISLLLDTSENIMAPEKHGISSVHFCWLYRFYSFEEETVLPGSLLR